MRPQQHNKYTPRKRPSSDRELRGTRIEVRNGDVAKAMRTLKKVLIAEGVFKELRERRFFEKPSMTRKKAKSAARKRWQKKLVQQQTDD